MERYCVVSGKYAGRIGMGKITKYGTVMFYPIEGKAPYRVCLMANEVKKV